MKFQLLLPLLMVLLTGGCNVPLGGFASDDAPQEAPPAVYAGLAGQRVAVMVWASSPIRTEFNQIQLDLARMLENKLIARLGPEPEKDSKKAQTSSMQFLNAGSVVRYQREHPEVEALPITEVAPKLGRSLRLIYIEVEEFQIQSPQSILLLKGIGKATLRVVEVENGQAHIALEEKGITVLYPKDSPAGVVPTDKINERTVYEGTVTRLAEKIAQRFERKG